MSSLVVLKYNTPSGAEAALDTVKDLAKQQLLVLEDAAYVSWPEDKKKPKTKQLMSMSGLGALDGSFWGLLFGLIFFVPLLGAAIGAVAGAIGGAFVDVGINDEFIENIRNQVTKGTSALFLLVHDVTADRVIPVMKEGGAEVIQTNLSAADDAKLRAAFSSD